MFVKKTTAFKALVLGMFDHAANRAFWHASNGVYLVVFKPGYQSQSDNLSARCDRIMFRHFQMCEAGPSSSQDTSHVSSALVQLSSIECSSENLKITVPVSEYVKTAKWSDESE